MRTVAKAVAAVVFFPAAGFVWTMAWYCLTWKLLDLAFGKAG